MDLSVEARVWNRAALEAGGAQPHNGDRALAAVLLAHGLVMNGGVHHALEMLSPDEVQAAAAGFRMFSLGAVAELLETAMGLDEKTADRRYWDVVPDDGVINERFSAIFRSSPDAFAPLAC